MPLWLIGGIMKNQRTRGCEMLETKTDVKKTAVLVIDMQNDLVKAKEEPFNGG